MKELEPARCIGIFLVVEGVYILEIPVQGEEKFYGASVCGEGIAPRSDIPAVSAPSPCLSCSAADLISFFNVLYLMYEDAHSGT